MIAEALYHDIKPAGIVLNASSVIGQDYGMDKAFKPVATNIFFQDNKTDDMVREYFSEIFIVPDKEDSQTYNEDFLAVRSPFRSTLLQSVIEGKVSDEIASLKKCDIPLQLFFGLEDNMLNIDYLDRAPLIFWRDTINKLPQAGHFLQTDQPAMFNKLLEEYLEERFKAGHVS